MTNSPNKDMWKYSDAQGDEPSGDHRHGNLTVLRKMMGDPQQNGIHPFKACFQEG